jgi:hypothetical protein
MCGRLACIEYTDIYTLPAQEVASPYECRRRGWDRMRPEHSLRISHLTAEDLKGRNSSLPKGREDGVAFLNTEPTRHPCSSSQK